MSGGASRILTQGGGCRKRYRISISKVPVIHFRNTGEGTFSKILASLRAKSKIGGLEIVLRYSINNNKKAVSLHKGACNLKISEGIQILYICSTSSQPKWRISAPMEATRV